MGLAGYFQISLNTGHPAGSLCLLTSSSVLEFQSLGTQQWSLWQVAAWRGWLMLWPRLRAFKLQSYSGLTRPVTRRLLSLYFSLYGPSLLLCALLSASRYADFHNCVPGQCLTLVLGFELCFMICDSSLFLAPLGSLVLNNGLKKFPLYLLIAHSTVSS